MDEHCSEFRSNPGKLKRLVLCLDGTWNSDESKNITNIVRIRDLVDPKFIDGQDVCTQRVYYDTGVGTGFTRRDRFIGGGTGAGLEENVRQAYRFLSMNYARDVEIYLFGFSRGAFTARSLAGYLGGSGLLRPEHCTRENEDRAWAFYRTPPGDRYPHDRLELRKLTFEPDVRIKCIGVFDTVGALGIPTQILQLRNRRKYSFHDVTLGANIDYAFHALAIDETRGPFGASVWQYPNHKNNLAVEQVWFPGVHANIGGGYPEHGISDLVLGWMLSRIEAKGLGLRLIENWRDTLSSADPLGKIHESRTPLYTYSRLSPKIRMINQSPFTYRGWHRTSSLVPNAVPVGEMLHVSALERWKSLARYRPVNLIGALDAIFDAQRPKRLLIAGKAGEPLDWYRKDKDRDELAALLPADYRKKMEDALLYWQTGGVDLSKFMDISRQTDPPMAQSIPLQRSLKVA